MEPAPLSLTVLHTNDIHSHFEMMSPLAAEIGRLRKAAGDEPVLLVDIGDHMDRAAVETEGSMGQANIDIMNLTGYEAITIGNNEGLTFTQEQLAAVFSGIQCPVICCNMLESATGEPPAWMKKRMILEKDGIKIGITGATAAFTPFYALLGWDALEPEQALREQCEWLAQEADLVIVLSHLGLPADKQLAERLEGVHAILGGHTHHVLEEPLLIAGTAVCGAGKFGRYLGRLRFERSGPSEGFRYAGGECLAVNPELNEDTVAPAAALHLAHSREALAETVAITDRALPLDVHGESVFGNLLAQAVRRFSGTDLSLVNTGQLLGTLPAGKISAGMLHGLCPSPINPCIVKLSGKAIRAALRQSLSTEFQDKAIYGYGFRGNTLGSLAIDGVNVLYDAAHLNYDSCIEAYVLGEPLNDDKVYNVGTLDMFTFHAGYESLAGDGDAVFLLPHFLRDLLRMELQRPGSLDEAEGKRWEMKGGSRDER
ncbi:bifunctional UDP-sugar hydrolase/5'-nucleotidase [Paenibacillus sp. NFR01]|uniref:bifunctional metallophosphatase/5'-nucleotidase n=1 Tax=Paenibacillus sp. NFR01 TaxID=1566279 RepID=UPI0008D54866|nr:bifunctional UDP-sugar hydrolase/5'-nucleotidase [Paenibacillus sp. NFR01]SES91707.1 2',3'-cyclic-nucleotide 2'-phosphodiesterase/5'-or 3'-nucleotidase, 5'-nucleotidase family [Paenibacillus sp. NFR01]